MGALVRAHDWAATPLGPTEDWPESLRTSVSTCLNCSFPILIWWGPELVKIYNDAYAEIIAGKHPHALGSPGRSVWPEIWDTIGPMLDRVMNAGEAFPANDLRLDLHRNGYPEECYFSFSYSPIRDEVGRIAGVFCPVIETTDRVFAERRASILLDIEDRLRESTDPIAAKAIVSAEAGAHLAGAQAAYAELQPEDALALIEGAWADGGGASFNGSHRLDDFGVALIADLRQGLVAAVNDIEDDLRTSAGQASQSFAGIQIRSYLIIPLLKGGCLVASLLIADTKPRRWTSHEVDLVLDIAERAWSTVERTRARSALAAEREQFAKLFEQAPGFMCTMRGPEHVFEFANPAYSRLAGHRDLIGRPVREAFPEMEGQGFFEVLDQVYQSGEAFSTTNAEVNIRNAPDTTPERRFLDFVYQPIRDATGAVSGIFFEGLDVTAQAGLDQALRQSEEQLRLATEAAEIGFWDLDVGADILIWPPRVKAMFGISADQPISMTDFYAGLHREDSERVVAAFNAALDPTRRALYDVEYRTIGKEDGVVRWVAAKGRATFEGDQCRRVLGTALDITARKRVEAELRDLNETLERRVKAAVAERQILADIVESTDAFIQVVSADFRFLAINRASAAEFERVFGVRPKVGDHMLDLLRDSPDQRAAVEAVWSRALAGEEFTAIDEFGEAHLDRRYYEMKFNSLRDREGRLVGAFQFVYDVTDRLRDQARLAEAEAHLRQAQKIEAIGQLTGGVAHDFNNLLMVISGGLGMIERDIAAERRQRIMDGMRQAADRGASLSRQLLAFSRRQPLKPEPVDLREQIGSMHDLLDRTLRGDVHVRTALAEDLWPIFVDPAELELVILNLCVNARDAMPNGGEIVILAQNLRGQDPEEGNADFVGLSVRDSGTGMPADLVDRVFEPFFTTKEIGKGSGLGLPQVQGFAHQSGGSVHLESELGRGTTVTLRLPRSDIAPRNDARRLVDLKVGERTEGSAGVALLVEDDEQVAALVTEMLGALCYRVVRAATAQSALGALANNRCLNLVLSDIMMPGEMNGLDLARELRRRRPELPFLLSSGYAEAASREAEAEGIGILRKPYTLEALDRALRDLVSRGN
jgi:PAS domain S-box-containing protein